ncbi:hypothetical protein Vadar_024887 [Vaccinium darrowii]|uniref:Uncharacterized protein n=1 Tax=Vaccinium darrowii TaxID=229202 RepID=A0ACB7Y296_9ERIC|nr:hypothetical protein Vadar_024887 [Vaccinium darrowii]
MAATSSDARCQMKAVTVAFLHNHLLHLQTLRDPLSNPHRLINSCTSKKQARSHSRRPHRFPRRDRVQRIVPAEIQRSSRGANGPDRVRGDELLGWVLPRDDGVWFCIGGEECKSTTMEENNDKEFGVIVGGGGKGGEGSPVAELDCSWRCKRVEYNATGFCLDLKAMASIYAAKEADLSAMQMSDQGSQTNYAWNTIEPIRHVNALENWDSIVALCNLTGYKELPYMIKQWMKKHGSSFGYDYLSRDVTASFGYDYILRPRMTDGDWLGV